MNCTIGGLGRAKAGMGSATVYGKPASRRANTSGMGKVAWK